MKSVSKMKMKMKWRFDSENQHIAAKKWQKINGRREE